MATVQQLFQTVDDSVPSTYSTRKSERKWGFGGNITAVQVLLHSFAFIKK